MIATGQSEETRRLLVERIRARSPETMFDSAPSLIFYRIFVLHISGAISIARNNRSHLSTTEIAIRQLRGYQKLSEEFKNSPRANKGGAS